MFYAESGGADIFRIHELDIKLPKFVNLQYLSSEFKIPT